MIAFLSPSADEKICVKKEQIRFVSIPDNLPPEEIKDRFSQLARDYANALDTNIVYLIYGKENSIKYDYSI